MDPYEERINPFPTEKWCHPERSETESKDLRTKLTIAVYEVRRFFDSLTLAQNDKCVQMLGGFFVGYAYSE